MYLLNERKALVEQYFCVPITDESFSELCNDLYFEGHESGNDGVCHETLNEDYINNVRVHLPYSLGCNFTDEAMDVLYNCFASHGVFKDFSFESCKSLFNGSLSSEIKCRWGVRFGYIMHQLAVAGLITRQYQAAIERCGYIIAPGSCEPMSAKMLKDAIKRAKVYLDGDNTPWKRTVNIDLKKVFDLMGVEIKQRNRTEA